MELRHVRYFVAVAEEQSFRRAADRLHVSQPALGRQVRDLEAEIGVQLFERSSSGVVLTVAGDVFLESARQLLRDSEVALQSVSEAARGERGRLRIGNVGSVTAAFLPELLETFHEDAPQVDLDVIELSGDEQLAALKDDEIQIGFHGRGYIQDYDPTRFTVIPIQLCNFVVAMPRKHRLASLDTVPLTELANETLLNFKNREATGYERWIRTMCERAGFEPKLRRPALDNLAGIFSMVAAGQGLVVLTDAASQCVAARGRVTKPLTGTGDDFELVAVIRRDHASLALKRLLNVLDKAIAPTMRRPARRRQ